MTKHKVFLSYYHKDDQHYKDKFEQLFGDIFINKSVMDGEINTDVSTEYIKRLIQTDYLSDTSVLVVLIGKNTLNRKHVDWEISAALSSKVGGNSGLVGLLLPTHPNFVGDRYNPSSIPERLNDNIVSGYTNVFNWTEDTGSIKQIIETAFNNRVSLKNKIDNSRIQYKNNRS